jgi:protein-ribulosamine 3-kinase
MTLNKEIKNKLESTLGEKIISHNSVSGGCINDARIITTETSKNYFVKINFNLPDDMFMKESNGLKEIKKANSIRVPEVYFVFKDFIILEAIDNTVRIKNFSEDFGRRFASMHKFYGSSFGFYEDNYIGSNPQKNIPDYQEKNNWINFYFNKRLYFQFSLAEQNGYVTEELQKLFLKLENKIYTILGSDLEKPSLLHGDLWGGNYIVDEKGEACLIDPAVYYGNREADLAMTKLFGGFDQRFYRAYQECFPLADGLEYRENIYKLYHVLNHLNLFGMGYYRQAIELIRFYI